MESEILFEFYQLDVSPSPNLRTLCDVRGPENDNETVSNLLHSSGILLAALYVVVITHFVVFLRLEVLHQA